MAKQGIHIIQGLRRRYMIWQVVADVLLALSAALIAGALLFYVFGVSPFWALVIGVAMLIVLLAIHQPWHISNKNIASFLNSQYPELQESSDLILLPPTELNVLQTLALNQAEHTLSGIDISHKPFTKRLWPALLLLAVAVMAVIALVKFYPKAHVYYGKDGKVIPYTPPNQPEVVLPQVDGVELSITPPAYTGRAKHTQDKFNMVAEEGAVANWQIKTNIAIKSAWLLFNDNERIALTPRDGHKLWVAQKIIARPCFYQVSIDGKLSDLYQVQVIKDAPPILHIKTPKPYTYIDAGETQQVNISTSLNDDYGIADALIVATVAKGKGEGVKFKEYKINFPASFSERGTQYNVQKLVSLPALNMEPGDELYFYVQAHDTHQQLSRTDVYTVSIQDTAALLSMDGILTGSNLKPEFFRSERQIIIDAEQLIKEKDTISVQKFNNRSNDLGIDQKLLRLRYGKFLGEEGEDKIGSPDAGPADPADFSNATKILKEYTDDHDNAADASFFEPAIKAQLKATLTEMWKAELQLRLYKPQAALPFAYKALRLLKDLQQKSRSFVAKTSYNPPPLKMEKRLSGELDKIIEPLNRQDIKPGADEQDALKKAVNVLEGLKIDPVLKATDSRVLQLANQQLAAKASAEPGIYLTSLSAMRRILAAQKANAYANDIDIVERAIQKTLNPAKNTPSADASATDMGLSEQYYKNLKQAKP
ncbi:hypothetical protein FFF34_018010 [Inquilinus sp. KBS0705]|nr:hypothetical protein FFF34_018010 [Inquilinus sp. KBS0705]